MHCVRYRYPYRIDVLFFGLFGNFFRSEAYCWGALVGWDQIGLLSRILNEYGGGTVPVAVL